MNAIQIFSIILLSFVLFNCAPTPPKVYPLNEPEDEFWEKSRKRGQQQLKSENEQIQNYIASSGLDFNLNKGGIWLHVIGGNTTNLAKRGDVVTYKIQVESLTGNVIYSFEDTGEQKMVLGKQKTTRGLLTALLNIGLGKEGIALVPSSLAHGYFGDNAKIGTNEPLVYKIGINHIEKTRNSNKN